MRWISAWEFAFRRSRLSSRKVIWAVERDSVRTLSSSIRMSLSARSVHTRSCGRWPSTDPCRSLSRASAAASRCSIASASAWEALIVDRPARRIASSHWAAWRSATPWSRRWIASAISAGANRRAPSSVACWITSSASSSARFACRTWPAGILSSRPGRTSVIASSPLARRISVQRSGSPRCCAARSRSVSPSSTRTVRTSSVCASTPCPVRQRTHSTGQRMRTIRQEQPASFCARHIGAPLAGQSRSVSEIIASARRRGETFAVLTAAHAGSDGGCAPARSARPPILKPRI
jgi:hypothetical protein